VSHPVLLNLAISRSAGISSNLDGLDLSVVAGLNADLFTIFAFFDDFAIGLEAAILIHVYSVDKNIYFNINCNYNCTYSKVLIINIIAAIKSV
jgi:hypothetical protein